MALGKVTVNNLNLNQGEPTAIENLFLFIGTASLKQGEIVPVNTQSDFFKLFGEGSLTTQLTAAVLNANTDWNAYCVALSDGLTWQAALDKVMKSNYLVEGVVICDPVISSAEIEAVNSKSIEILNATSRRLFFIVPSIGIDSTNQTWADYLTTQKPLVDGVLAERVLVVPQIHGNNIGLLAGRLANSKASYADSPMRVNTGALVGIVDHPLDKDGEPLDLATLRALDAMRLSVPQFYHDYPGWYFADGNMLATETSDYKVIEYLRIIDKACRDVRLALIPLIADRSVNNTGESVSWTISQLMVPLRRMSQKIIVNGKEMVGAIRPPVSGDIVLQWLSNTKVVVYVTARPYNSPKDITANVMLDLSQYQ